MKIFFALLMIFYSATYADNNTSADPDVAALIKDLGADNFKARKAAKLKLISMGSKIIPSIKSELEKTTDPEMSANLKEILENIQPTFNDAVSGTWTGEWRSDSSPGYLYKYTMTLKVAKDSKVTGQINWTLLKSPTNQDIGKSAIEYVEGTVKGETKTVEFKGVNKDDPEGVIGLDEYIFELKDSSTEFTGKTNSHGSWKGILTGKKEIK